MRDAPWLGLVPGLMLTVAGLAADRCQAADTLVGYWKLDAAAGEVAVDGSPSRVDATIRGAQWAADDAGRHLEFYGSGEYLVTADPAALQLHGAFTISFWLNPVDWPETPSQGIVSKKKSERDPGFSHHRGARGRMHGPGVRGPGRRCHRRHCSLPSGSGHDGKRGRRRGVRTCRPLRDPRPSTRADRRDSAAATGHGAASCVLQSPRQDQAQ